MVELKTNPSDFLAEFPQFTRYLREATHKKIHAEETKVIDKGDGVLWVETELKYGNVKKPLGTLTLVYQQNRGELINKHYIGRLPTIDTRTAKSPTMQFKKDPLDGMWERKDFWSVPFP
jgi:hypothetical protein